jgi:hypothetical protein
LIVLGRISCTLQLYKQHDRILASCSWTPIVLWELSNV